MSHTRLPYVTVLPFLTDCCGMKAIVLVPVFIRSPTPFARRPNSLAKDVFQVLAVVPLSRSLYCNANPVVGSTTEFIVCWERWGRCWMARMLAAMEYRDAAIG